MVAVQSFGSIQNNIALKQMSYQELKTLSFGSIQNNIALKLSLSFYVEGRVLEAFKTT